MFERGIRRRGDGVEDAEQRVGMALFVTLDQFGIVEIVTGIHADTLRQTPAHGDFRFTGEQRDLDAVDLRGVLAQHGKAGIHGGGDIGGTPVAFERGVEHVAEPVDDDRLLRLREHVAVDADVILARTLARGKGAARHEDDPSADAFDRFELFEIGVPDRTGCHVGRGGHMIGAHAGIDLRALDGRRFLHTSADEVERVFP